MAKETADVDFQLLRILEESPEISQREIAQRLKISVGTVNFCLKALTEKGWVKAQNFRKSNNRLKYAYILTPAGLHSKTLITRDFLKRKIQEYEALQIEISELREELAQRTDPKDPSQN